MIVCVVATTQYKRGTSSELAARRKFSRSESMGNLKRSQPCEAGFETLALGLGPHWQVCHKVALGLHEGMSAEDLINEDCWDK